MTTHFNFFHLLFSTKKENHTSKTNQDRNRSLRLESLEERRLLSVTPYEAEMEGEFVPQYVLSNSQDVALIPDLGSNTTGTFKNSTGAMVGTTTAADDSFYSVSEQPLSVTNTSGTKTISFVTVNAPAVPFPGYDSAECTQLQAFLEQTDSSGVKNGTKLNPAYSPTDPTTWLGVTWLPIDGVKRATFISWSYKEFSGSLDVSGCTALKALYCGSNQLTSLDVSGCTALETLSCDSNYSSNQFTSLNVSGCTALDTLSCYSNQLPSLDLSGCTALTDLDCDSNQLTSLDLSKNTALTHLECSYNPLTSLDVSKNTALEILECFYSQLTSLDVSGCTALWRLECYSNQLTSLDVSGCTALKQLYCWNSGLQTVTMSSSAIGTTKIYPYFGSNTTWMFKNSVGTTVGTTTATNYSYCTVSELPLSATNAAETQTITFVDVNSLFAPTLNTPSPSSSSSIALSWNSVTGASGYEIQYSTSSSFSSSETKTSSNTSYTVPNLNANTTYYFKVKATATNGIGSFSSYKSALTYPAVPAGLIFTDVTTDNITLSWTAPVGGASSYKLEYSLNGSSGWEQIGGTLTKTSYSHADRLPSTTYYYRISAKNASGYSSVSSTYSKTTAAVVPFAGYDSAECTQLQAFLEQTDSSGVKNGTKLNSAYSSTDPTTWTGVTWETIDGVKRATSISWKEKALSGSLGLSGCTALTELRCYSNQLTSLDVSGCTALTELRCYSNQLTSLDVSGCTALTSLYCYSNQLTSLDVSKNTALNSLYCYSNQLTSLDVSKNTALYRLYCYSNQLTSLDVSKNTALDTLFCSSNQLTSLDVSKNTALDTLSCSSNQLTSLDVSKNTALEWLYCYSNQLTSLDVSKNTALEWLYCYSNQLTSLDVSKNTALAKLYCWNSGLQTVKMSSSAIGKTKIYPYSGSNTTWTFKNSTGTTVGTTTADETSYYTVSELPLTVSNNDGTQSISLINADAIFDLQFATSGGSTQGTIPSSITYGNTLSLTTPTITNTGAVASGAYSVEFYASTSTSASTMFDSSNKIGTVSKASLVAGGTTNASYQFNAADKLSTGSTYYFGWKIVSANDSNLDNNSNYYSSSRTVQKVPLTITAKDNTITYGSEPTANGYTLTGFVNGDTISSLAGSVSYSYNYSRYGNAGTYQITPSGLSSSNYAITYVSGVLTVDKKSVTLSSASISKVYDGTTSLSLSQISNPVFSGTVNGDSLGLSAVTGSYSSSSVGTRTVTITAATLSGTKAGNYRFSQSSVSGTISAPTLSAPTLNQPTVSGTTVSVSWSSVANASSYALEYKLSTASTWTTKSVAGTSTTFTGVPGSTYDVRVKAVGTGNYTDSIYSAQRSIENAAQTKVEVEVVLTSSASASETAVSLPTGITTVREGSTFYAEIWMKNVNSADPGITGGNTDLTFNSSLVSAQSLNHGNMYGTDAFITGTINNGSGLVDNFGGGTLSSSNGKTSWVRLGYVVMTADGEGETTLSLAQGSSQFAQYNSGSISWSAIEFGSAHLTITAACVYDIDGSGQIDFGDLSYFAGAWQSTPTDANWNSVCDFDNSGQVDFGDLSYFAGAFGKSATDPSIVYPGVSSAASAPAAAMSAAIMNGEDLPIILESDTSKINVELTAVTAPSSSDSADSVPEAITRVSPDDVFYVEIWMKNVSNISAGITGGNVDLTFNPSLVSAQSLNHGNAYGLETFITGVINNGSGLVDNFGGGTLSSSNGKTSWVRLGYVAMQAQSSERITLDLAQGNMQFSLFQNGNTPWSEISLGSLVLNETQPLSAPTLNQPTASETTVSVSWSSVANASSYALEYKLSTASSWTTQTVSGTSATFTGTVGSTYDVRVKAVGAGTHSDSAYSSVQQIAIPESTIANNDFTRTKRDTAVSIDALANDRTFSLVDIVITLGAPSFGSVALNEDGTFLYTPNEGFFGTDVFAYSITDNSGASSMAAVSVMVQAPLKPVVLATPSVNRAAGALPKSVAVLSDWDSCFVELWLPDDAQLGTGTTSSTFVYNPAVYKDPVLSSDSDDVALVCSAPILRDDGMAEIEISITVTAPQSSSGDSLYLGVISLDPNAEDGGGLTNTAPAERLGLLDGQAVETTVEPFAFDLQQNGQIDLQDFIEFAKMFNQKVEGNENPLVTIADFDGLGTVDMQDFILFALNFNKRKSDTANEPLPVSSFSQSPNVVATVESEVSVPAAECADVSASCFAASSELSAKPAEALSIPVSTATLLPLLPRHVTSNAAELDLADSQNQETPVTASSVNESTVRDQVICDWDEYEAIASGLKATDCEQSESPLNIDWFDELEFALQE